MRQLTILFLLVSSISLAQENNDFETMITSQPKSEAELAARSNFIRKNFKETDENYFYGHLQIAQHYAIRFQSSNKAFHHLDTAAVSVKNFPFSRNTKLSSSKQKVRYGTKEDAIFLLVYTTSVIYKFNRLPESSIKVMEANSHILKNLVEAKVWQYYNELVECYMMAGDNTKVIELLTTNKDFFIKNPVYSFTYYGFLSAAYTRTFKYKEAIPYAITYDSLLRGYNTSSNTTINSSTRANAMMKISGFNLDLRLALFKTGKEEQAFALNTPGRLDEIQKMYFQKDFTGCKSKVLECRSIVDNNKANENKKGLGPNIELFYENGIKPFLIYAEVGSKNYEAAHQLIREDITRFENKLQEDFYSFSESQRKDFFVEFQRVQNIYYSFIPLYAKQSPPAMLEMLNQAIQTKGLILDITGKQETIIREAKDASIIKQINTLKKYRDKVTTYSQQAVARPALADSVNKYSALLGDLQRRVNENFKSVSAIQKITWQDIQKTLKQGESFVEIVFVNRDNFWFDPPVPEYWAFVIKPGVLEPQVIFLGEGTDFEKRQVKYYQNQIQSQLEDMLSYNVFWKKIAQATLGQKRIYLSTDGLYQNLNPLILLNPITKKFVMDEVEIVRVFTSRDMLKKPTDVKLSSVALIGNPNFTMSRKTGANQHQSKELNFGEVSYSAEGTRAGFSMLPGTQKEITIIASQSKTNDYNTIVLEMDEATEHNVKNIKAPSILHIATHGQFDSKSGGDSYLRSKLVLAGASDPSEFSLLDYERFEDGLLTAYEVTQFNLTGTRLVTLSACETGLGEIQSGEGVWGLQRAFQLAGAQSVMGSLWKISDEATVTYMEVFYKSLFSGASTQQAYATAMKETKLKYPHPYFWGAFLLNGLN